MVGAAAFKQGTSRLGDLDHRSKRRKDQRSRPGGVGHCKRLEGEGGWRTGSGDYGLGVGLPGDGAPGGAGEGDAHSSRKEAGRGHFSTENIRGTKEQQLARLVVLLFLVYFPC